MSESVSERHSGASNDGSTVPSSSAQPEPGQEPSISMEGKMETNTSTVTTGDSHSSTSINRSESKRKKKKLMIKKLEKKLKILDKHIKKYNETELTLEEMDSGSSVYMKEDLYKRKFVATWRELCELVQVPDIIEIKGLSHSATFSKTPFPEINRRVERLIKLDQFPDYFDVVELIERCNQKHNLGISAEEKSALSRQIFKEVGSILKECRQRDFISHFGGHLTDKVKLEEDPSLVDEVLLEKLKESYRVSHEKMEQMCEEYVSKQEQEVGRSLDEENSPHDSSDEDSKDDQDETVPGDKELDIDEVDIDDEAAAMSPATNEASDNESSAASSHKSATESSDIDTGLSSAKSNSNEDIEHDDDKLSEMASNDSISPSTPSIRNDTDSKSSAETVNQNEKFPTRETSNRDDNGPNSSADEGPPAKKIKLESVGMDTSTLDKPFVQHQSSDKDSPSPSLPTTTPGPVRTDSVICIDSDDEYNGDVICID